MGTAPQISQPTFSHAEPGQQQLIQNLLKVQRAAKKIGSILDMERLVDSVVHDISRTFGLLEVNIYLRDENRDEMIAASTLGCAEHAIGHALKIGHDGMVGHVAFTGAMHYAPDVSRDPYYLPCELDAQSAVAIPLKLDERVIGVFNAVSPELDGFSQQQLNVLRALCDHVAIAIENARSFQRERELNSRFSREAEEARLIQQQLLPKASLLLPPFSVSGSSLPVNAVGGDWYDYIELADGKLGVVLADVSGKGIAAALLMSATRSVLRAIAENVLSPGEVLRKLNASLLRDFPTARFVTMVYGVLDPVNSTFTFANAGHLWPVVLTGDSVRALETQTGLPLGIAETTFSECMVFLAPGSRVLLYSDGISEAINSAEEEYGSDRLNDLIRNPQISTAAILEDVAIFSSGQSQKDDATVVLISARN